MSPRSALQPSPAPEPEPCPGGKADILRPILGKGFLQAWLFIMLFSPVIHGASMGDVMRLGNVTMAWCLGFVAISLVGAVPWSRFITREPDAPARGPWHNARVSMLVASVTLAICTLLLEVGGPATPGQSPWVPLASVLSGVGSAMQCWCWGASFTMRYSRRTGVYIGAAFAFAAIVFILVAALPPLVATIVTTALPLAGAALFVTDALPAPASARPLADQPGEPAARPLATFARALVGVALLGFSESFSRMLFQAPGAVADPIYPWALLLATLIASVLVALVSLARPERDSIGRINHVLMLVMALLLALMPALQGLGLATDTANLVCRMMFYLIIEVLFAQVSFIHGLNARVSYALGLGVANGGCLVGILLGRQLAPAVAASFRLQVAFAVLAAVLVFAAFLFVVDERTFVELLHVKDGDRPQARRFTMRCDRVSQEYRLTAKETEVMMLAAKGNTAQRIAEALGISVGTVNVHLNHAYRKMGVHSRQEMLDLIDAQGAPASAAERA
ncbi:MAG: hypothetical protein KHY83_06770 [Coriobacteriia bacterium]|nr:hypothetical protein [Coriobacteriia bacterium]MBS5478351.1 hypothetical protein [Coriobacteriia bacterium]